ncbi:hypothetical protein LCGC14_1730580 [marine sediment metagenome]|uniref:Uncharacterized protein n=1 Tax=marine sediment metagenome TaxID=412755 RepID=A0A0F9JQC2_9ZZZZ
MIKFYKNYGFIIFLGVALNEFADLHVWDWQLYAIFVPFIALVIWKDS